MPSRLAAPVLSVDAALLHKVDTRNAENLFALWTLFSKCSSSLDQGRRLENLSWRVWARETLCCEPSGPANSTTPAISRCERSPDGRYTADDVPSLSGSSCDSLPDEDDDDDRRPCHDLRRHPDASSSTSVPLDIALRIRRPSSVHPRSRGRERHLTPDDLEKLVMTIKEEKVLAPLDPLLSAVLPSLAPAPAPAPQVHEIAVQPATPTQVAAAAIAIPPATETALPVVKSTTSVVRGFSPAHPSSSYRTTPLLSAPSSIPNVDLAADATASTIAADKQQPRFALGGSSGEESLGDASPALPNAQAAPMKKTVFNLCASGSSNEDEASVASLAARVTLPSTPSSLPPPPPTSAPALPEKKRAPAFARPPLEHAALADDVFEDTDEDGDGMDDEDMDESAIDEDDSSDWEDSIEDSGETSPDPKAFVFQRVDSRPTLTSRRSMITTLLHQSDRAADLANAASRSTSALQSISRRHAPSAPTTALSTVAAHASPAPGSSVAASPADSDPEVPLEMKRPSHAMAPPLRTIIESEVPRSAAQPIIATTTNTTPHFALSPRTTRRNMLAHELTVSLRQHLLWERQHKSQFKRRHTACDLKDLKQYPEKVHLSKVEEASPGGYYNRYFDGGVGEYNAKGW